MMDFISIATSLGAKHARVPFFATYRLTKDVPFDQFPKHYRFGESDRSGPQISEEEVADIVQSWLFFGLIGTLLGREIDPGAFRSVTESGDTFVDLSELTQAMSSSKEDRSKRPNYQESSLLSRASGDPLVIAKSSLGRLEKLLLNMQHPSLDLVTLSVQLLVHWWSRADPSPFYVGSEVSGASARALRKLMLDNGWCEYHWGQVRHYHDIETLYYLATIPRHTGTESRHGQCTSNVCRGWGNSKDVSAIHVTSMCQCPLLGISTQDLCQIIDKGDVPLITTQRHKDGRIDLKLKAWDGWTPYTAISHVWADGLGNTSGNSLPQCQLQALHQYLSRITPKQRYGEDDLLEAYLAYQSHPFWLDTLCIPVKGPETQSIDHSDNDDDDDDGYDLERQDTERILAIKRKAIDGMGFIYASASPVLALDAELIALSNETEENALISMITYSGWMTRAWTLQEGSLPKKLVFAWSGSRIYDFEARTSALASTDNPTASRFANLFNHRPRFIRLGEGDMADPQKRKRREKLQRFWRLHVSRLSNEPTQNKGSWERRGGWRAGTWRSQEAARTEEKIGTLQAAWNSLSIRHTSQPQDVPIILANLLRLQTSDLHHQVEPIAAIIGSLSVLPLSIFFLTGQRAEVKSNLSSAAGESMEGSFAMTASEQSNGYTASRPSKIVLDRAKNTWVPKAIEGEILSSPLYFNCRDYSLSLCFPGYELPPCQLLLIEGRSQVPGQFYLLSSEMKSPKLLIQTYQAEEEKPFIREVQKIATGLYVFLEDGQQGLRLGRDNVQGAVFAAIGSERRNAQTIFCYPFRALVMERNATVEGADNAIVMRADPQSPRSFQVLYDKDALGSLQEEYYSSQPQHSRIASNAVSEACIIPAISSFAFTVVIFINPRHAKIPALGTLFAVYWALIVLYSTVRIFLRSWFLRFRVSIRFKSADSSSVRLRIKLATFTVMHYLLNSTKTYLLIFYAFHWGLVIAMITAGGTVGALFAFAQALLLGSIYVFTSTFAS